MKLAFQQLSLRLGDMTLELDRVFDKRVTGLFGPSGSGKTSLLELVAGLRRPDRGAIELDGEKLTSIPARKRAVGYVPQDLALFPHLTVRQNISYGMKSRGHPDLSHEKVCEVLEIVRLLDRAPCSLSGGEKQRVAMARALLASPKILLLDEPLASLDQSLKERILPYLERVRDEFSIPMIYVTHSAAEIVDLCEEVVVLQGGKCSAQGRPDEIFAAVDATVYRLRDA